MIEIIPSILSKTKKDFLKRLKIVKDSKKIQVDIMDGRFVKNKSIPIKLIPCMKNAEAHLMVYEPSKYIDVLAKKGFKKIIFHYEVLKDYEEIINLIKKIKGKKMIPAIAINPETKVSKIKPILKKIKNITILTVNPGFYGSRFLPSQLKKIKEIKKINKKIKIEVDGGIDDKTAKRAVKAGADVLIIGSFIFENGFNEAVRKIRLSLS